MHSQTWWVDVAERVGMVDGGRRLRERRGRVKLKIKGDDARPLCL